MVHIVVIVVLLGGVCNGPGLHMVRVYYYYLLVLSNNKYLKISYHFFLLFGSFVRLQEIRWTFSAGRFTSRTTSQGGNHLLKTCNCNGGGQIIRTSYQSNHYTIYSAMFINKGPTHIWEYASAPYTTLYYIQCHVY